MPDESPLLFRKVLGSLRPTNASATDALAALDDSEVRVRITRTKGNARRNALYWACLNVAAPMLSERIEGEALNVNLLHCILKKKAGKFRLVTLPSGDVIEDFDSISFAKMPEPERAEFIQWSLDTLAKWLGVRVEDLKHEGQAA